MCRRFLKKRTSIADSRAIGWRIGVKRWSIAELPEKNRFQLGIRDCEHPRKKPLLKKILRQRLRLI